MIICHPLKLIFFKTYKTSGTSFESVLSNYCSPECITTDGRFIGKQNHIVETPNKIYKFGNHTRALTTKGIIKDVLKQNWWDDYKKITIHRNPFDVLISMFYDATKFKHKSGFWNDDVPYTTNFIEYAQTHLNHLDLNISVGPIEEMDFIIRYEHIREDIEKLSIDNFWEQYSMTFLKANIRPWKATIDRMYENQKDLVDTIYERCKKEIEYFNYKIPLYNSTQI